MKKLNLIKKHQDHKRKKLENKVQKRESRIQFLKHIDEKLAEITLDNLTVRKKPTLSKKPSSEEQSLYYKELELHRIETELMHGKKAYLQVVKEHNLKVENVKQIEAALANVGILNNALKFDTKDNALKKALNKLNAMLLKIQKNPSKKEFGLSILNPIVSILANLSSEDASVELPSQDEENVKLARTLENQLLEIKKIYDKKLNDVSVSETLVTKQEAKYNAMYEKNVYKVKVRIARLTHKNKVTKDVLWWMNLSKEEQKERRCDLSFYAPDTMGYWLTLLSVVAEIVYLILLLGGMVRSFWVGATILLNIAFLLLLFTVAIKVKNYKKTFSYISIAFGVYCILRISYVIHGLMGVDLSAMSTVKLAFIYGSNAYMIIASIFVGVRSYLKIKHQMMYLSENKITKFQLSK